MPQVQTIRDLLDGDALCCVVKERELRQMLENLKTPPRLVVTDSQAFLKVAADTPRNVPLTSFSILMSRFKGDLLTQVQGATAIDSLRAGDRILVAEACSHHPIGEDIGRVKIPRWLTQYVGGKLEFDHVQGRDFPADLSPYKLVIHCGACTWNRRAMLSRVWQCRQAGVPITNYGLTIAYSLGIFERALEPFPSALQAYRAARQTTRKAVVAALPAPERPLDRGMDDTAILGWLREQREEELNKLWAAADRTRRENVGDAVHLRGLIEISSHCVRECAYCGLRRSHRALQRYRMGADEILAAAHQAAQFGYGTVVLQAGEDTGIRKQWMTDIVRRIKAETSLAVTLSLGERRDEELAAWREAGADRYLLRFETSDPELFDSIHPSLPGGHSDRIAMLRRLRGLGYEAGSGVMVGIPGQTYATLLRDLRTFQELDLDMIGIGPYLPHPATPLAAAFAIQPPSDEQAPNTESLVYRMVALTRILCPQANIPSTSALATINKHNGRELGLARGANVVMPNVTPVAYRKLYQIYPGKACVDEDSKACNRCLGDRIAGLGRVVGRGPGSRPRLRGSMSGLEAAR
jgi:biotin synthase